MKSMYGSGDKLLQRPLPAGGKGKRMKLRLAGLFPTFQHEEAISAALLLQIPDAPFSGTIGHTVQHLGDTA